MNTALQVVKDTPLCRAEDIPRKLVQLQETLWASPDTEFEEFLTKNTKHHFAEGLYARELFMPAGSLIVSKTHKITHFCFVMSGKSEVIDEFNGGQIIEGPCMLITQAGTKRALRIITDSVWIAVHATEETDIEKIEEQVIAPEAVPRQKRVTKGDTKCLTG